MATEKNPPADPGNKGHEQVNSTRTRDKPHPPAKVVQAQNAEEEPEPEG